MSEAKMLERQVKPVLVVYGDGIHDDYEALQKYLNGEATLIHLDGSPFPWLGQKGRTYCISKTLQV